MGSNASGTAQLSRTRRVNITCVVLLSCASVKVIHVLHDGDEDTEVVYRLHQLANRACGLQARVEADAICSPFFCLRFLARKVRRQERLVVRILGILSRIMEAFLSQVSFGSSASHLS